MAIADMHPDIADLEAFTLGTLDDASLANVESHVADCPTCQERAAGASGDTLVELLRRVHAQSAHRNDTVTEAAVQAPTPAPVPVLTEGLTLPPSADGTDAVDVIPPELARHERYRVRRLLGAGGMGSVYEAEHRVMERAVAVKVINRAFTTSPAAVERFRREVRAAAKLSHPNIVSTYDAEDAGNSLFLVMEYVEGISLARLVKEGGPLPVAQACDYVRQAALGLQHAHERGMVHRDIKPDNLMLVESPVVSAPGVVKVLDFGLASLTAERGSGLTETNVIKGTPQRGSGLTEANVVMGTPDYMAPEQAEDARKADIRADVYSLGCTLYYLLTGSVPYPADTSLLKILAHREQPLPSLRKVCPAVPPELGAVVARLLAKQPKDRYQTPTEVAAALEPFTQTGKPGAKKRGRKHGWRLAAAVLFAGLIAATGVVFYIKTDNGTIEIQTDDENVKIIAEGNGKQFTVLDPKSKQTWVVDTGEWTVRLDGNPDGLKIEMPNTFTLKRGDKQVVTIKRVRGADQPSGTEKIDKERTYRTDGLPVQAVAVSPDSRFIAAAGGYLRTKTGWALGTDLDVHLLDRLTGKELRRFKGPTGFTIRVVFSPDGSRVAAVDPGDHCAYVWDVDSGKLLHTLRGFHEQPPDGDAGTVTDLAFAPDGKRLLTTSWDNTIRLWDAESGKEVKKLGTAPGVATAWQAVAFLPGGKKALVGGWGRLVVLDLETDKVVRTFDWPGGRVGHLSLSADAKWLLTTGADGSDQRVRLWDVTTGKKVREFDVPADWVAFLPDGRRFLMTLDKELRLVDTDTGAVLETFRGHEGVVQAIALVPTGPYVISGSHDQTVRQWRLPDPPAPGKVAANPYGDLGDLKIAKKEDKEDMKPVPAPKDAIVLFDGKNLDNWTSRDGKTPEWKLLEQDGVIQADKHDIITKQKFDGAFKLHVEFRVPYLPDQTGQQRGNSGVYVQGRYEVQILDSYGLDSKNRDCGAIYLVAAPSVNACKAPTVWQSYDIEFISPKCVNGKKTEPPVITVFHNGVKVHDKLKITSDNTFGGMAGDVCTPGPILLQFHGDPVQFRNVWLVPMK